MTDANFEYWSGVAAFSQTLATVVGVVVNVSLFVCLRLVPLGELKVFIPLIVVHSSIDLTHVFLNAIGVLRAVNLDGKLYLALTGSISTATEPWFSVLLSSYFWTIVLESLICCIGVFYRYLLVCKGFKPTVLLVAILTFLSGLVSAMLGMTYFFALSRYGTSDDEGTNLGDLTQKHGFWRRKIFDYAVIDTKEHNVRTFLCVLLGFCAFCYLIAVLFLIRIRQNLSRFRATGNQTTAEVKLHKAANNLMRINVVVPVLFYHVPVLLLLFVTFTCADLPIFGYLISVPYCWMPAFKALGILVVMPSWRRAARRWLKGNGERSKAGINQRGRTVHPRISHIELSTTSKLSGNGHI